MIGFAIRDDVKAVHMHKYEFWDSPESCFVATARLEARKRLDRKAWIGSGSVSFIYRESGNQGLS